ncbi:hypothetical protein CLOM_g4393 [Closterium sp. NIES-68]|nr:hypothetical protein CLOM_g15269 [Closterium sp. NIES-68]GJP45007.1 hypothetical protein CLOM_g4393 [Closterium sp. NIES-68]GJP86955.1 hypothetical protein CLOP_g16915 [Closterium sp. NIES-67]
MSPLHTAPSLPVPQPRLGSPAQQPKRRSRIAMMHEPTTAAAAAAASTDGASAISPAAPSTAPGNTASSGGGGASVTGTGGKRNVVAAAVATGSRSATLRTTMPSRTPTSSSPTTTSTIAFPDLQSPYFPFEEADFLDAYGDASSLRRESSHVDSPRQSSARERVSAFREGSSKPHDPAAAAGEAEDYDLSVAERAVQLSCRLTQKVQAQLRREAEDVTRSKPDRSYVTVADWGVQAVVSWVLKQAYPGEVVSMVAEEDTKQLTSDAGTAILARLVGVVNECLAEARLVGIEPPESPLEAPEVLELISRGSSEGGAVGRHWILDPVDGTLGFVRDDQYAIALALLDSGSLKLGVLGCPNFPVRPGWLRHPHRFHRITSKLFPSRDWGEGVVLKALRGHGAFVEPLVEGNPAAVVAAKVPRTGGRSSNGSSRGSSSSGSSSRRTKLDPNWRAAANSSDRHVARAHVSTVREPSSATFCEPVEKANSNQMFTAGLADLLGISNDPLRVYSMAKYAAIARGDADIFMKFARNGYQEKVWDHAAGVVIVEEAGGIVTDAGGKPLDFTKGRFLSTLDRGIVASSSAELHQQLLSAIDASWRVYHGGEFTPQETDALLMLQQQSLIQVDVPCEDSTTTNPLEGSSPHQELLWLRRQKLFPLPAAACALPSQNGGDGLRMDVNEADMKHQG